MRLVQVFFTRMFAMMMANIFLMRGAIGNCLTGLRQEVPEMLVQITTEAVGIYTPEQQAGFGVCFKA